MKRTILRIRWRTDHWSVELGRDVLCTRRTQAEAVTWAFRDCRGRWSDGEPCQLFLHGRDGRIRWERTYGRDPVEEAGMKVFYLCHPVSGRVADNVFAAKEWLRWLYAEYPGVVVIAPWLFEVEHLPLRDDHPEEREQALRRDEEVVRRCDGVVLCGGRVSAGMARELGAALEAGREVMDLTHLGPVPPPPWRRTRRKEGA